MDNIEYELKISTIAELEDHLGQMSDLLYGKAITDFQTPDFENLFRIVHSIKGNTRACGYESVATFSHSFESKLINIKNGSQDFTTNLYDMCLYFLNTLNDILDTLKSDINLDINLDTQITQLEGFSKPKKIESKEAVKLNILLIDDDENIQDIISNYIDLSFEATIFTAQNGIQGLEMCSECIYDVIVCDYKMPELDGSQFISKLRLGDNQNNQTPIIFLSGYKPEIKANKHIWDAVFFTDKPFTEQKLIYYIKCALKLKLAQAA